MHSIVDLIKLQSALNAQDELDKNTFSLVGSDPAEAKPALPGSEDDATAGKNFMVDRKIFKDKEGNGSTLKLKLAQSLLTSMKKK